METQTTVLDVAAPVKNHEKTQEKNTKDKCSTQQQQRQ